MDGKQAVESRVLGRGQDRRSWLSHMQKIGEVVTVKGAEREAEIGGIVDIAMRQRGRPAVLFENIPNYGKGFRVIANLFTSVKRIAVSVGLPETTTEVELVRFWRDYMRNTPTIAPKFVNSGALLDNIYSGDEIDLLK